ncbi:MAG: hypothetical protein HKN68_16255 [Saprospiraceae bacterium]|nr:hypothetical protein [Saprospiraceae bacterium]
MSFPDFDYYDILDALEDRSCVLFLGPGIYLDEENKLLEKKVWETLDVHNSDHPMIKAFYENDGFYLFREENYRRKVVRRIKRIYEQEFPATDTILQKLSRIPFPVVFNLSPDNLLARAYDSQLQNYHSEFYFMGQPFKEFIPPTEDRTLIYGMLGNHEEPESMVMTHKDLFSYLESIFQGKSMSPQLRKLIQDTDTFIFLGLPFEKWYMQLLMRVLYHISSRLERIEQYAAMTQGANPNRIFKDEFRIQFAPDHAQQFIDELYNLCDQQGKLKPIPEKSAEHHHKQLLKEALNAFSRNRILKGIDNVRTVLESYPEAQTKLNELIFQRSSYEQLYEKEVNSLAMESDKIAMRQTIARCISMVSEVQKMLGL